MMDDDRPLLERNVASLVRASLDTEARPSPAARDRALRLLASQLRTSYGRRRPALWQRILLTLFRGDQAPMLPPASTTSAVDPVRERLRPAGACPELVTLRDYHLGTLDAGDAQGVHEHLARCQACRTVVANLKKAPAGVGPPTATLEGGWRTAWALLRGRPRWAQAASLGLLVVALALVAVPPVRSTASSFLGVFRVQRFAVAQVDQSILRSLPDPYQIGTVSGAEPEVRVVDSVAEAERLAGLKIRRPARLPAGLRGPTRIEVSTPSQVVYTVDENQLRAYLASLGAGGVQLPPAEQMRATIDIPGGVGLTYSGDVGWVVLLQGRSPTVEVPGDLDVLGLRERLLAALPSDLALQFGGITDWAVTAVLPAPRSAEVRTARVDGVEGAFVSESGQQTLLWQRDGVLYGLHGTVPESVLREIADSLADR